MYVKAVRSYGKHANQGEVFQIKSIIGEGEEASTFVLTDGTTTFEIPGYEIDLFFDKFSPAGN
mgnify:FL=1|jgi:hypothetical protein